MLTLLFLLACPTPTDDSTSTGIFPDCRTEADCTDGSSCFAPGACNVGDYSDPTDACSVSADCGTDLVCQPVAATCGMGDHNACLPSCATRGCADDEQCDTTTGICAPWSCEAGYVCEPFTTCAGMAGDANGCVRDTCVADGDCGAGGYCVGGACFDALGTCSFAVP